jgi:DNA polymerase-3 subunit chi
VARVDFYVLNGSGDLARKQFACRLAEKAYRLSHRVHILAADPQAAAELDDLLWTYRDGSFVPHEVVDAGQSGIESPVTIGHGRLPDREAQLLINLTDREPDESASFPRIAEIVTSDDDSRQRSRKRYAHYRDLGHTLETHKL